MLTSYLTIAQVWKLEINLALIYRTFYEVHQSSHWCPFCLSWGPVWDRTSLHASAWSPWSEQICVLHVFYEWPSTFEEYVQLLCRMSPNSDTSDVSSQLDSSHILLAAIHQKQCALPNAFPRGVEWKLSISPPVMLTFIFIAVRVVSSGFLHCKVTIFPFVMNQYFAGDSLRLGSYSVSHCTFTHWC